MVAHMFSEPFSIIDQSANINLSIAFIFRNLKDVLLLQS